MRLLILSLAVSLAAPAPAGESISCTVVSEDCPAKPEPPLTSYSAVRKMSAANGRYKLTGWMEARTAFDLVTGFRFEITGEGGSGYIRNKVLRKVLELEAEAIANKEGDKAGLTTANYTFGPPEPAGEGLLRITLKPRRKDRMLVDGFMIVTATDRDLVRIEGRLAKPPSFWTRRVNIVRTYGRVDGSRVPVETTSTASVMLAGESSFTMKYAYEQINGTAVRSSVTGHH